MYSDKQRKQAFDKLEVCVKNTDCKAKCINEIDDNKNFLDCYYDLAITHHDL